VLRYIVNDGVGGEVWWCKMRFRSLFFGILVAYAAVSLSRALVTTNGVGPIEYVVGIVLVAVLIVTALRATRRAIHQP
jgi:hypothetical protein